MKTRFFVALVLLFVSVFTWSQSFNGPLPQRQQEIIQQLASSHKSIQRELRETESGYEAITTSADASIASLLQEHVTYMAARLAAGGAVRQWDPAYRELMEHIEDIEDIEVRTELLENGISVSVTSSNSVAGDVARNHGSIVTLFVKLGLAEVENEHTPVAADAP